MEAHKLLAAEGLQVTSYGVGSKVKLPGPRADAPNVYEFDSISYRDIHRDLLIADPELYNDSGLLCMLKRNMKLKRNPQRWQSIKILDIDVVITFEERVFLLLLEDVNQRQGDGRSMLVVNMDVVDRHEEARIAGPHVLQLCNMLNDVEDWLDNIDDIMEKFTESTGRSLVFDICFT